MHDACEVFVRTTLDVDDEILMAAKEMARQQHSTAGKVLSELARQSLTRAVSFKTVNGIPQLPVRPGGGPVTPELVRRIQDELDMEELQRAQDPRR